MHEEIPGGKKKKSGLKIYLKKLWLKTPNIKETDIKIQEAQSPKQVEPK